MIARTFILAMYLPAMVSMTTPVRGDDEVIGLAGNEQLLWVGASVTESESETPTIRFRCLKGFTAGFRRPDGVGSVTGRFALLAVLGDTLHVVYEDGPQWSYTYREGVSTREATGRQQVSTRLPAPAKPWAWSASAEHDAIYAVVPGSAAASLSATRRSPPATHEIKAESRPDTQPTTLGSSTGMTETLRARPLAGAVVRFAGGRWWPMEDQLIPDWFDAHQQVWLAAGEDTLHLLYRTDEDDAEIRHTRRLIHPGATWSDPEPIGVRYLPSTTAAVVIDKKLYFVYAEPNPKNESRIALRVARRTPGAWETGPYLNDDDQPHDFDASAGPVAISIFDRDIATAQRSDTHAVGVMFWDPHTGTHRSDRDRTARLDSKPTSAIDPQMAQWLLLLTITVLFMAAFRRRQLARPRKDTPDENE